MSIRMRRKLPCSWAFMELPARLPWWWRCLHKPSAMHTSLLSSGRAETRITSRYMRRLWSSSSSLHCWHSWLSCSIWTSCVILSVATTGRGCGWCPSWWLPKSLWVSISIFLSGTSWLMRHVGVLISPW